MWRNGTLILCIIKRLLLINISLCVQKNLSSFKLTDVKSRIFMSRCHGFFIINLFNNRMQGFLLHLFKYKERRWTKG